MIRLRMPNRQTDNPARHRVTGTADLASLAQRDGRMVARPLLKRSAKAPKAAKAEVSVRNGSESERAMCAAGAKVRHGGRPCQAAGRSARPPATDRSFAQNFSSKSDRLPSGGWGGGGRGCYREAEGRSAGSAASFRTLGSAPAALAPGRMLGPRLHASEIVITKAATTSGEAGLVRTTQQTEDRSCRELVS